MPQSRSRCAACESRSARIQAPYKLRSPLRSSFERLHPFLPQNSLSECPAVGLSRASQFRSGNSVPARSSKSNRPYRFPAPQPPALPPPPPPIRRSTLRELGPWPPDSSPAHTRNSHSSCPSQIHRSSSCRGSPRSEEHTSEL